MQDWIKHFLLLPVRHHFFGSLGIVLLVSLIMSGQITDRTSFADSELRQDVMERWGAPIAQPAPSVRFVQSGSVFNDLEPLALSAQHVEVDAAMNYRKRGLVYFSGFDFAFRGDYRVVNDRDHDIDLVFIFPVEAERNQILLSDMAFQVDGKTAPVDLSERDALVWTGRAKPGQELSFAIRYRGRGLEAFTYELDPKGRVNDFKLKIRITGGINYDYQSGVVPALEVSAEGDAVALDWRYGSLESGVPVGLILPSEQSFDQMVARMVWRSPVPFLLFFCGLLALSLWRKRALKFYETYLVAAGYGLFFVLLAYFAAFMNFYAAYGLAFLVIALVLSLYLRALLGKTGGWLGLGLLVSFQGVPTLAVVLEGYTGLIYTLEILTLLIGAMVLTTRKEFGQLLTALSPAPASAGGSHES